MRFLKSCPVKLYSFCTHARTAASNVFSNCQNPNFDPIPEKKEPPYSHSGRVSGPGWDKLGGEKSLGPKALGGLWARSFPPLFWQSGRYSGIFSTGTPNRELSGFSGIDQNLKTGKEARIGLIYP